MSAVMCYAEIRSTALDQPERLAIFRTPPLSARIAFKLARCTTTAPAAGRERAKRALQRKMPQPLQYHRPFGALALAGRPRP